MQEPDVGKIIGISVGAAVALIVIILIAHKVTGGNRRTDPAQASNAATDMTVTELSTDTPGSGEESSEAAEAESTEPEQTVAEESTEAASAEEPEVQEEPQEESASDDPSAVPVSSEFTWFDNIADGASKADDYFTDAKVMSGADNMDGMWKAYLRSIPGEKSSEGRHFLNVKLESSGKNVTATLKWGVFESLNGDPAQDESSLGDTELTGTWDAGEETITATGTVGKLYVGGFVKYEDKEYGFGVLQANDGTKDYLIFMR